MRNSSYWKRGMSAATMVAAGAVGIVSIGSPADATTPHGYVLSIIAGNGTYYPAPTDGAQAAKVGINPDDVATDGSGNLYVADNSDYHYVEKITPTGTLSVFAGGGAAAPSTSGTPTTHTSITPLAVAADASGNVYIADLGYVEKVTPSGTLSIIAGNGDYTLASWPTAGPATKSSLDPTGLAVDAAGNLYIADDSGFVVKVTPSGTLSIIAGNGDYQAHSVAGPAKKSPMSPTGVAVDSSGNVYIADAWGYVDKVTPAGTLSIVAGGGADAQSTNGTPATKTHIRPLGVATDASGNVYFPDASGYVDRVAPSGTLSVIAGTGNLTKAPVPGLATSSPVNPQGLAVDASGNIDVAASVPKKYAEDPSGGEVLRLTYVSAPSAPTGLSATAGNQSADLTWTAPGSNGGASVTGYKVQSSADGGKTWSASTYLSAVTSWTAPGLKGGSAYVFRIAAVNEMGQGPWSAASSAVTPYVVAFTGYVHGCVCVHGTAMVSAAAPAGSTVTYSWKVGSVYIAWHHNAMNFGWSQYKQPVLVKILVVTPDGRGWPKYYNAGTVVAPA